MKNNLRLKGRIVEKGYTLSSFAEVLGLSRAGLRNKMSGVSSFRVSEVKKMCDLLDIEYSEVGDYFFG